MELELDRSIWFAGDAFSAADIQMSYPIEASVRRAGLDQGRPKLIAYLERIRARPAYQRAAARGDGAEPLKALSRARGSATGRGTGGRFTPDVRSTPPPPRGCAPWRR